MTKAAAMCPPCATRAGVYELYFGNIRYRDASSMREGVILVIHDVTQSYELDRSRREFVANASHELRTPLTTIKMVIEALAGDEGVTKNEMNKSFLDMAETRARAWSCSSRICSRSPSLTARP